MTREKIFDYFEIEQPIGSLFYSILPSETIIDISDSNERRSYNNEEVGIQRKLDPKRIKDIVKYCKSNNAMFPTPVVLSADSNFVKLDEIEKKIYIDINSIKLNRAFCSIIDGQHRIQGIKDSGFASKFKLMVIFAFDLDITTEAKLFSIINGKQKPISKSMIYDLSRLSKMRTIEKLCSETVQFLNVSKYSKLENKIKMLGYKEHPDSIISQSALVNSLIKLISKNPTQDNLYLENSQKLTMDNYNSEKYILRKYFINFEDQKISKLLLNFFNAWMQNLTDFNLQKTLIGKTIGFNASFELLVAIVNHLKSKKHKLSEQNFYSLIYKTIQKFTQSKKTTDIKKELSNYGSSQSGAKNLSNDLIKSFDAIK